VFFATLIVKCRINIITSLYDLYRLQKISKTVLPFVLYGCLTWSHRLREERRLKVFENRVLRRMFGPKEGGGGSGMRLEKTAH